MDKLSIRFERQSFGNEYRLVNGVAQNQENPEHFLIPPDVIKRNIQPGFFVELRVDSPRFSTHVEDAAACACPSCNGEMSKPILRHEHPTSLTGPVANRPPSRGWGEDFWVKVIAHEDGYFIGTVDNQLCETRLHGLDPGDEVAFHADHVLALHPVNRADLVGGMNADDLRVLADLLRSGEQ